jgi:hypothetical protein
VGLAFLKAGKEEHEDTKDMKNGTGFPQLLLPLPLFMLFVSS